MATDTEQQCRPGGSPTEAEWFAILASGRGCQVHVPEDARTWAELVAGTQVNWLIWRGR